MAIEQLLKKLKVIDILQFELDIQLEDFVEKLNSTVDKEKTGAFARSDRYYSKSKSMYIGEVGTDQFIIREAARGLKLGTISPKLGHVTGSLEQRDSRLIVNAVLKGYGRRIKLVLKMVFIFYLVTFLTFSLLFILNTRIPSMILTFSIMLLIQIGFVSFLTILFMRDAVAKLKYKLPEQFREIAQF